MTSLVLNNWALYGKKSLDYLSEQVDKPIFCHLGAIDSSTQIFRIIAMNLLHKLLSK